MTSPGFESSVRILTKRQPPLYEEYKERWDQESSPNDTAAATTVSEAPELHQQAVEEILEAAVFNLIQELNSNYVDPETRDKWHDLTPVQPTAFVNVNENKECF